MRLLMSDKLTRLFRRDEDSRADTEARRAVRGELLPGERALASATTQRGAHVVATERALLLPTGETWQRLPWHELAAATWDDDASALHITPLGAGATPLRVRLGRPGAVPEVVRERVTASVVVSTHVRLPGGGGVRVVGRRHAGADELAWDLVYDTGTDSQDPDVQERAQAALMAVRDQTAGAGTPPPV